MTNHDSLLFSLDSLRAIEKERVHEERAKGEAAASQAERLEQELAQASELAARLAKEAAKQAELRALELSWKKSQKELQEAQQKQRNLGVALEMSIAAKKAGYKKKVAQIRFRRNRPWLLAASVLGTLLAVVATWSISQSTQQRELTTRGEALNQTLRDIQFELSTKKDRVASLQGKLDLTITQEAAEKMQQKIALLKNDLAPKEKPEETKNPTVGRVVPVKPKPETIRLSDDCIKQAFLEGCI